MQIGMNSDWGIDDSLAVVFIWSFLQFLCRWRVSLWCGVLEADDVGYCPENSNLQRSMIRDFELEFFNSGRHVSQ